MNKYIRSVALSIVLTCVAFGASACQSNTDLGKCIGITDKENPKFEYKISTTNAIIGVIFIETVIVPIYIVLEEFKCPVEHAEPLTKSL